MSREYLLVYEERGVGETIKGFKAVEATTFIEALRAIDDSYLDKDDWRLYQSPIIDKQEARHNGIIDEVTEQE